MKRLIGPFVCILLTMPALALAAPLESTITLWPAKTNQRAFAVGAVSPPRPGQMVRVRFLHDSGSGFVRIAAKRVRLSDARDDDGDGYQESHYKATFERPQGGDCKLVVVYPGDPRTADARSAESFPCAIPDFASGTATITSENGIVDVRLLIAETGEQLGYGLMYRRWLAQDKGMAFQFSSDSSGSFYMLNTLIPLSIAFYDQGGRILKIMDMEPCDDEPPTCLRYNPGVSYRGALEVNKGAFASWGVKEGDIITITR